MGRREIPLPWLPPQGIRRSQAFALGVTEWRWRSARVARPFHGVALPSEPAPSSENHTAQAWREEHLRRASAYLSVMRPGQCFAGMTACVIWRLPVPTVATSPQLLEVVVTTTASLPRRAGVIGRRLSPALFHIAQRDGFLTLDPASLWVTVGPRLTLPDRLALGDAIVRVPRSGGPRGRAVRPPHATIEQLAQATAQPRLQQRPLLLEALPLLRTGSASAPESHLRLALIKAGLPEPELDVDVYDANGRYLGTTECVYPEFKVALEYEGDHHRTLAKQWNRDIDKQADYEEAGWAYIRITAEKFYRHRATLMGKVRRTLLDRGWRP